MNFKKVSVDYKVLKNLIDTSQCLIADLFEIQMEIEIENDTLKNIGKFECLVEMIQDSIAEQIDEDIKASSLE